MTNQPRPTRRRLLGSVASLAAAGVAAGTGTWAVYSDQQLSKTTVATGTLDLTVDGGQGAAIRFSDAEGGNDDSREISIHNDGSIDGKLALTPTLLSCETDDVDNHEDRPCEWHPDRDASENQASNAPSTTQEGLKAASRIGTLRPRANAPTVRICIEKGDTSTTVVDWTSVRSLNFGRRVETGVTLAGGEGSTLTVDWRALPGPGYLEPIGFGLQVHLTQL